MVCDPLGVRDCCLVTDGGGALVVVAARARARAAPAGRCSSSAPARPTATATSPTMPDLTTTAAVAVRARARSPRPGSTPADVDARQLYDAFTITPILFLEDLGFCAKGEGGAFVAGGRIAPGRRAAGQHQRRRPLLRAPGHVRPARARRGGAPAARRVDGQVEAPRRPGARQRRRAVEPVHRPARAEATARATVVGSRPWTSPSPTSSDLIRSTAREFADRGRPPVARPTTPATSHFDTDLVAKIADQGYLGAIVPREYGGAGLDYITYGAHRRGDRARRLRDAHRHLGADVARLLDDPAAGAPRSRSRSYLPQLCSGEWLGCFGLTEPDTGSDAANQRRARRRSTAAG